MAALCWWCALGLPMIRNVTMTEPLGTCWKCHVFACGGHAEWDRGAGKWLCLTSAAQALAAGAGLAEVEDDVAIRSTDELAYRLPALTVATEEDRRFFRSGAGEGWLGEQMQRLSDERGIEVREFFLFADAMGVARFVDHSPREPQVEGVAPPEGQTSVVPGLLGELVAEAP